MLFLPRQARDKHRENSKKDRFLARRRPCGPPAATRLAGGAETNTPFEWFPYVCPEPVLVKSSFIYINGSSKRPFCYLRDTAIAFSQPRNKTILLPRQARDTRERTAGEKKGVFLLGSNSQAVTSALYALVRPPRCAQKLASFFTVRFPC
jgi:hypothetical protein